MTSARLPELLEALDQMVRHFGALTAEREQEILLERATRAAPARALVREPEARLLAFTIGASLFGVPLDTISAITMVRSLTTLPGVPRAFAGLLTVRGRHVTAIDLVAFLDDAASPRGDRCDKAVLVRHADREIAILAEELVGIREVFAEDVVVVDGPAGASAVRRLGRGGLQIVDVDAMFEDPRLRSRGDRR